MIKCVARGAQGAVVVLGLSHENLRRLRDGQPIRFYGDELGLPGVHAVTIFAGESEDTMEQMLREHGLIGPGTRVERAGRG